MAFIGRGVVASHSTKIPLEGYLHEALFFNKKKAERNKQTEVGEAMLLDLMERYPWLKTCGEKQHSDPKNTGAGGLSSSTARERTSVP